jgi:hypothetical protein
MCHDKFCAADPHSTQPSTEGTHLHGGSHPPDLRAVAATTATASTSAPATRSARAASTSVAPVVITSSTMTTRRPRTAAGRGTDSAPARLASRPADVSPAWSATPRVWANSLMQRARTCRMRSSRTAAMVMRSAGSCPRARTAARAEGTGTRSTSRTGVRPRAAPEHPPTERRGPWTGSSAAARTLRASAAPRGRARPIRPDSLCATIMLRTAPSYAAAAYGVGRPWGAGEGHAGHTGPLSRSRHRAQSSPGTVPQPAHTCGSTRSSNSSSRPTAQTLPAPRARRQTFHTLWITRWTVAIRDRPGRCRRQGIPTG